MKNLTSVFLLACLPGIVLAGNKKIPLSEALKSNSISLEAVNFAGSYQGKTTRLSVTNNTKSVMYVYVDPGTFLKPSDSAYQPMLLAGEEEIVVLPHSKGDVDVQTFCGDAPRHCPRTDQHYSFSHVGNDSLVKVLRFIKTNGLFDHLGQNGVWAMTNNHSISSAYDPERDALSKEFIALLMSVTSQAKPTYYTATAVSHVPDEPVYVPKVLKIYAQFEIVLDAPKTMTLGIYDEQGKMAQPVFENKEFGKMGHRFDVEFEAENVVAGKYFIRLKEGETVLKETVVKVE